jgi:DHA2 family multidrug resistance protein
LARALQGLGIATLFVPVSQLAYSNLAKSKSNKASSLTNLFRNQGGSFGIAFVTTMLARRTQYHQSVLVAQSTPLDERYRQLLENLTGYWGAHGFSHADAVVHAQAQAFGLLERQATFLAFLDCFTTLGWFVVMGVPLLFLIRRFRAAAASDNH